MKIQPKIQDPEIARRFSYPPIGDQLDAVMKLAAFLQESGMQLPPEVEAWVGQCQSVKNRFPKQKAT